MVCASLTSSGFVAAACANPFVPLQCASLVDQFHHEVNSEAFSNAFHVKRLHEFCKTIHLRISVVMLAASSHIIIMLHCAVLEKITMQCDVFECRGCWKRRHNVGLSNYNCWCIA